MPFWDDRRIEPKRTYRFLVPFRVFLPKTAAPQNPVKISDWAKCGHDLINVDTSKFGSNNVFWFMAQSVTKPGLSTNLSRTQHAVNGYSPNRRQQPVVWEFDPISLQLIDTYDHDIEMSITAMAFAMGGIEQPVYGKVQNLSTFAGTMVPIDNGTTGEFHIFELLEAGYGAAGRSSLAALNSPSPTDVGLRQQLGIPPRGATILSNTWARKLVLKNPYLVSADFGSLDYSSNSFSTVSLQITYDTYDLVSYADRHVFDPSQFSVGSMGALRQQQMETRRGITPGRGRLRDNRLQNISERQQFRAEEGHVERGRTQ